MKKDKQMTSSVIRDLIKYYPETDWFLRKVKGEASTNIYSMQIGWMASDFRNLTPKFWANLDNPIKTYDFSKFWLISCMPPSKVALCYSLWCHNRTTVYMELYTNFTKFYFSWKYIFPLPLYLVMSVHAFMIELDQPDYSYPREKKVKVYA